MNNLCNKVFTFEELLQSMENWGATVYGRNLIKEYDKKRTGRNILLVSHEASHTGAPIALFNFAQTLKSCGDNVVYLSRTDDSFREEIVREDIPFVVYEKIYEQPAALEWTTLFNIYIVNTLVGVGLINMLAGTGFPVLWWVHEAETSYHKGLVDQLPQCLPDNIGVCCGGSRPANALRLRRPLYRLDELLYPMPDIMEAFHALRFPMNETITFLCIGTLTYRKGQDLLADAFEMLPDSDVKQARLVFVGNRYYSAAWERIAKLINQYPENVFYVQEYPLDKLRELELRADCIICPSRDDPMPCVITEMLMMSKIVITSENAGQAKYIRETGSGYVYENNNPAQLAELISNVIHNREKQRNVERGARKLYEEVFSEEVFIKNANRKINQIIAACNHEELYSVSVVVPTYNGLSDIKSLVPAMKAQKRVNLKEILVVDSGSKDGTELYAEQENCTVITISQEQFSHSYARNLGASKAIGRYILFMTQDALPEDEYWLSRMLQPLKEGIAVAVSCRQIPRKECDLYGKVTCWMHAEYMQFPDGDRVLSNPSHWNNDSVRKNAQLDDVACLISAEVFRNYQYRGDYAEDLDLGIRLIQSDYYLALLNSARVIHSHTRPAYYHLRRAIVDNAVIKKLLPESAQFGMTREETINKIITAYLLTQQFIRLILTFDEEPAILIFQRNLNDNYESIIQNVAGLKKTNTLKSLKEKTPFFDKDIRQFISKFTVFLDGFSQDSSVFPAVFSFAVNNILDYLGKTNHIMTNSLKEDFCDAVVKRLGTMIGIILSQYNCADEEDPIRKIVSECKKGI